MEGQFFVKTKIISQAVLEIAVSSRFCPYLADFLPVYHRPSKTACEMIFVFTKNGPSIVVIWSYVGHVAGSRSIPCCHLGIGVTSTVQPVEQFDSKMTSVYFKNFFRIWKRTLLLMSLSCYSSCRCGLKSNPDKIAIALDAKTSSHCLFAMAKNKYFWNLFLYRGANKGPVNRKKIPKCWF